MAFKSLSGTLSNGPISEADPNFETLASNTDRAAVERASRNPMSEEDASKEMRKLAGDTEQTAKYKIEVTYLESRKSNGPSACQVSVWESGKRFHGGGDQSMFWCVNADNPTEGCGGLIPDNMIRGGVALCPNCKNMVRQDKLPISRVGVFTPTNLAKEITKVFRYLGGNADVYLKFHRTDAGGMTRVRAENKKSSEAAIYTLKSIMRDTLGGADVTKRFEAFLTA